MGLRLHRAMGWGGIHPNPDALTDRLWEHQQDGEVAALMVAAREKAETSRGRLGFIADMPPRPENSGGLPYPSTLNQLVHCVCGPDGAEPGDIWIIAPPGTRGQWHRRDDDMDYQTKRWSPNWEATDIQWLDNPPYPYDGWCWEDPNTGELAMAPGLGEREDHGLRMIPPAAVGIIARELGLLEWKIMKPVIATWWS